MDSYDSTDLGSPEVSTEGNTGGNLEVMLLGDWLVSLDRIELGTNVVNELGLSKGEVFGTILVNVERITLGIDIGTDIGFLDGCLDGSNDGKLELLLLGDSLVYNDVKVLVTCLEFASQIKFNRKVSCLTFFYITRFPTSKSEFQTRFENCSRYSHTPPETAVIVTGKG